MRVVRRNSLLISSWRETNHTRSLFGWKR